MSRREIILVDELIIQCFRALCATIEQFLEVQELLVNP